MARPSSKKPSYYRSRKGYYAWINGKQECLASGEECGDTYLAALRRYEELTATSNRPENTTIRAVFVNYLTYVQRDCKKATYEMRNYFCRLFMQWLEAKNPEYARMTCAQLTPFLVEQWLDSKRENERETRRWGTNSVRSALSCIRAAFNWGSKKMGTPDPLRRMKLPAARSRSPEAVITKEEHQALKKRFGRRPFAKFIEALWQTGCRPGEMAKVTAAEVKTVAGESGEIVYLDLSDFKTKDRSADPMKRERWIMLPPSLAVVIKELCVRNPSGPLFRNERNVPYRKGAIAANMRLAAEKLGLSPMITAYSYRHAFATEWIAKGKSIAQLAQLLGTSVAMLEKHYCKKDVRAMAAAIEGFRTEG